MGYFKRFERKWFISNGYREKKKHEIKAENDALA